MAGSSWRGYWWVTGTPEDRVPGHLIIGDDGSCRLELTGGLDVERFERPFDASSERIPAIYGEAEGKSISLHHCFSLTQDVFRGRSQHRHDIHADQALIGAHVAPDEPAFTEALLEIENLSGWLAAEEAIDRGGSFVADPQVEVASVHTPEVLACEHQGWRVLARTLVQPFQTRPEHGQIELHTELKSYLVLVAPEPVPAGAFPGIVLEMMDLVTLASRRASGQLKLTLVHAEAELVERPGEEPWELARRVEVHGRRIHAADRSAPAPHACDFLFRNGELPFNELVPRWIDLRRRIPEACNVFFGLAYAEPVFTEVRLLLTAIAAEALHTALYPEVKDLPEEDFIPIRQSALEGLTGEGLSWAKSKLRNQPNFGKRLRDLAARADGQAVARVIPDVFDWSVSLVKARNSLAHTGNDSSERDIFLLEQATRSLVTLVLMAEIGLGADTQRRAAENLARG